MLSHVVAAIGGIRELDFWPMTRSVALNPRCLNEPLAITSGPLGSGISTQGHEGCSCI